MNSNRDVNSEIISQEEADKKGKEFLESKGFNITYISLCMII